MDNGRILFPKPASEEMKTHQEALVASEKVIENTIGYARELETIV